MAVTLRDVANKAGVTPVVVSKVLHNKANGIRVSEATAQRVREAANELGYRVNIWARNFRTQQTMALGVLHGTGFPRPLMDQGSRYFASLMDGIIEGAFRHDYSVTLCPKLLGDDPSDGMNDGRFDGLVWYSASPSDEMKQLMARSRVPIVALHAHTSDFGGHVPTLMCDNRQGIDLAIQHLKSLGHQKIAFAYEEELVSGEADERRNSFVDMVTIHGLQGHSYPIKVDPQRQELDRYLSKPSHTAIICFSDGLAADVIRIATQKGLQLPQDLSVIGFDSTAYCNELRPELTSISQPLHQMGVEAIEILVKRINDELIMPFEKLMPCGLDIRKSTAPPAI